MVRVLSCLAVVGLHTMRCDISVLNSIFYYLCGFAVPAFFMASGYILLNREEIHIKHVARKIGSIVLLTMIWNYLVYGAKVAALLVFGKSNQVNISETLLSPFYSLIQKGYLYHFWYMGALILVYILVYLMFRFKLNRKAELLWGLMVAICVTIQITSYICQEPIQKSIIQTFRLWTFIQYFFYGGILARYQNRIVKTSKKLHLILLMVFCAVIPVYQLLLPYSGRYAEYFYDDILTIMWVGLLFTYIMRVEFSERIVKAVGELSKLTMGVYIIHIPLLIVINHFITYRSFLISTAEWLIILMLSFIGAYIIARIPLINKLIKL